jgi:hypothetical protein
MAALPNLPNVMLFTENAIVGNLGKMPCYLSKMPGLAKWINSAKRS